MKTRAEKFAGLFDVPAFRAAIAYKLSSDLELQAEYCIKTFHELHPKELLAIINHPDFIWEFSIPFLRNPYLNESVWLALGKRMGETFDNNYTPLYANLRSQIKEVLQQTKNPDILHAFSFIHEFQPLIANNENVTTATLLQMEKENKDLLKHEDTRWTYNLTFGWQLCKRGLLSLAEFEKMIKKDKQEVHRMMSALDERSGLYLHPELIHYLWKWLRSRTLADFIFRSKFFNRISDETVRSIVQWTKHLKYWKVDVSRLLIINCPMDIALEYIQQEISRRGRDCSRIIHEAKQYALRLPSDEKALFLSKIGAVEAAIAISA
jgi:hypothetical protein